VYKYLSKITITAFLFSIDHSMAASERSVEVSTNGFFPKKGILFANENSQSVMFLNPGAYIAADRMSGLASALLEKKIAVIIVKYPGNLAINPLERETASKLAKSLKSGKLKGVPKKLSFISELEFNIAGHSMGAAILSDEINSDRGIFQKAFLIGASQFVSDFDQESSLEPILVYGTLDTLTDVNEIERIGRDNNFKSVPVEKVNHFCIIKGTQGNERSRKKDTPTDLTYEECNMRTAEAIADNI